MRVVAEWGQTCQGSVETAIRQAKATQEAGAWGAKWQLLRPDNLAASYAPAYWAHAPEGLRQRDSFTASGMIDYGAWGEVKAACDEYGVEFIATPFDHEAVDALADMSLSFVKIASGDITYRRLLEHIGQYSWTVLLSTGASSYREIADACRWLNRDYGREIIPLACDLVYPCPPEAANLARVATLKDWWDGDEVGYSDHTTGIATACAAAVLGATVLEKHCTLDRSGPVPDDQMALDPTDLAAYVLMANLGNRLKGQAALTPSDAETPAMIGARRSWHAARDIEIGAYLGPGDLVALRPCPIGTIPVSVDIEGIAVKRSITAGEPLTPECLNVPPALHQGLGGQR